MSKEIIGFDASDTTSSTNNSELGDQQVPVIDASLYLSPRGNGYFNNYTLHAHGNGGDPSRDELQQQEDREYEAFMRRMEQRTSPKLPTAIVTHEKNSLQKNPSPASVKKNAEPTTMTHEVLNHGVWQDIVEYHSRFDPDITPELQNYLDALQADYEDPENQERRKKEAEKKGKEPLTWKADKRNPVNWKSRGGEGWGDRRAGGKSGSWHTEKKITYRNRHKKKDS